MGCGCSEYRTMGKTNHPTMREGMKPERKKIHPDNENGGMNVELTSEGLRPVTEEINPPFGAPFGGFA
jgi:hypothetical protein